MKFQQKQDGRLRGERGEGEESEEDGDCRAGEGREQKGQTLEQRKDLIRETVCKTKG